MLSSPRINAFLTDGNAYNLAAVLDISVTTFFLAFYQVCLLLLWLFKELMLHKVHNTPKQLCRRYLYHSSVDADILSLVVPSTLFILHEKAYQARYADIYPTIRNNCSHHVASNHPFQSNVQEILQHLLYNIILKQCA